MRYTMNFLIFYVGDPFDKIPAFSLRQIFILIFLVCNTLLFGQGIILSSGPTERSGGSYQLQQPIRGSLVGSHSGSDDLTLDISSGFYGFDFDDNVTENGVGVVPPDACGAAGTDRVIAVVNMMIECRTKAGDLLWRDGLSGFFSEIGPPLGTLTFDPKVVWDHFEDRFVVVTSEAIRQSDGGGATDESHILLAVSKDATPTTATAADWWYYDIDAKTIIGGDPCLADYPGFEVDEEVVYVTNNMFTFDSDTLLGVRLWIIDKGITDGFYSGGLTSWKALDPYFGIENPPIMTLQPAQIFGAGGPGPGIGTYLVGYSSLSDGADEWVAVARVNNPLPITPDGTTFSTTGVNVGNIEDVGGEFGWPDLPDAPQLGSTAMDIEVNTSKALDAVWRNDPNHGSMLWLTATILPNTDYDASNAGQTTAHWFRLDTSTWPPTLDDQGNIGGDDIAGAGYEVSTFYPSLAVDSQGNAYFGFSASSDSIYCGAYAAAQHWNDPVSTVCEEQKQLLQVLESTKELMEPLEIVGVTIVVLL